MQDQQLFSVLFQLATASSYAQRATVWLGVQLPYWTCAAAAVHEWFIRQPHKIPRSLVRIFVPGIVVWVFAPMHERCVLLCCRDGSLFCRAAGTATHVPIVASSVWSCVTLSGGNDSWLCFHVVFHSRRTSKAWSPSWAL